VTPSSKVQVFTLVTASVEDAAEFDPTTPDELFGETVGAPLAGEVFDSGGVVVSAVACLWVCWHATSSMAPIRPISPFTVEEHTSSIDVLWCTVSSCKVLSVSTLLFAAKKGQADRSSRSVPPQNSILENLVQESQSSQWLPQHQPEDSRPRTYSHFMEYLPYQRLPSDMLYRRFFRQAERHVELDLSPLLFLPCGLRLSVKARRREYRLAPTEQVNVLRRRCPRPVLTYLDRCFWVALSAVWPDWRSALDIVKPEDVLRWHKGLFKAYWRRKCEQGRKPVSDEVIALIQ
jgi:hypothetical protein